MSESAHPGIGQKTTLISLKVCARPDGGRRELAAVAAAPGGQRPSLAGYVRGPATPRRTRMRKALLGNDGARTDRGVATGRTYGPSLRPLGRRGLWQNAYARVRR